MARLSKLVGWIAPFPFLFGGTMASLHFVTPHGSSLFYLPIALAVIFIHWWGFKVLPALVLNSFLTLLIWDASSFHHWPFVVVHEAATATTSYLLFRKIASGKIWLPDLQNTVLFIFLGILIPVGVNGAFVFFLSRSADIATHTMMVLTADFSLCFTFCLVILYFFTPWLERKKLIAPIGAGADPVVRTYRVMKSHRLEAFFSLWMLPAIALFLPMEKYWFIYGIFNIYIAVRFGFGNALLANATIFFILYILPFVFPSVSDFSWALETNVINVHLGMILLGVTACIIGRVISDLHTVERQLTTQFQELAVAHIELDRFVYSASHDLSAPLKSITGLVNISRMESNPVLLTDCISKIEKSARKLEGYIQEILDYSKNNRSSVNLEHIDLPHLVDEIKMELQTTEVFPKVRVMQDLNATTIVADKFRLKLILNNLLLNAMQYHKADRNTVPFVKISSSSINGHFQIAVMDNGQGIHEEAKQKVFEMFYRGNVASKGSGLGLYIAREAALRMNGEIRLSSTFGEGSTFTVVLPKFAYIENLN